MEEISKNFIENFIDEDPNRTDICTSATARRLS